LSGRRRRKSPPRLRLLSRPHLLLNLLRKEKDKVDPNPPAEEPEIRELR
jgi:hypothetical protein